MFLFMNLNLTRILQPANRFPSTPKEKLDNTSSIDFEYGNQCSVYLVEFCCIIWKWGEKAHHQNGK